MRKRPIQHKLRSRKGATLTLALMLLLVVSLVAAVVMASAVTTAKRVRSRKDTQQALLTLQSAVTMVRDQYTDSKVIIIQKLNQDGIDTQPLEVVFAEGPLRNDHHPLVAATEEALKRAYVTDCTDRTDEVPTPVGEDFCVSATVGEEELENAFVNITMRGNKHNREESYMDFQIELICSVGESQEQLDLKLDTDVHRVTSKGSGGNTTVTTTITWRPEGEA